MKFWVKTTYFIKKLFPKYLWDISNNEKKIYLTFDDGPTPEITEWVLEQLKQYNAKATFFCIGNNIEKHPAIFKKIIQEGHAVGNHTFNHLNGWKTTTSKYVENVLWTKNLMKEERWEVKDISEINTLFRPPYGKIKPSQSKTLRQLGYKIIMWDVLSYDFDQNISPEKCLENVLKNTKSGSIIIFHDSVKAEQNMKHALPKVLDFLNKNGFTCEKIT